MNKIKRLEELLKVIEDDKYDCFWDDDSENESLVEVDNAIEELEFCLESSIYELKEDNRIRAKDSELRKFTFKDGFKTYEPIKEINSDKCRNIADSIRNLKWEL